MKKILFSLLMAVTLLLGGLYLYAAKCSDEHGEMCGESCERDRRGNCSCEGSCDGDGDGGLN